MEEKKQGKKKRIKPQTQFIMDNTCLEYLEEMSKAIGDNRSSITRKAIKRYYEEWKTNE